MSQGSWKALGGEVKVRRRFGGRKLCPRCLTPMEPMESPLRWAAPEAYVCPKCGYGGPVALEEAKGDEGE